MNSLNTYLVTICALGYQKVVFGKSAYSVKEFYWLKSHHELWDISYEDIIVKPTSLKGSM